MWDSETALLVTIHEAVHSWCLHAAYESRAEHWLEEGLADWIAYKVLKKVPQRAITRYFEQPKKPTLYGSSFLWWLAFELARENKKGFSENLAMLHLGLRTDLIHGEMSHSAEEDCTAGGKLNETPHACVSKQTKDEEGVSVWDRTPRPPKLTPTESGAPPSYYFIWNGPVP